MRVVAKRPPSAPPRPARGPAQLSASPKLSDLVPVAYIPVECVFGPGEDFKHFDLKFLDFENLSWKPCEEAQLVEQLKVRVVLEGKGNPGL